MPAANIEHLKNFCYNHNLALKFFCTSCEEPICDKCQVLGPHNNKLHKISTISDSYQDKFNFINNQVQNKLYGKCQILMDNIECIEHNIQDIKTEKNRLESDLRIDYTTKFENIRYTSLFNTYY